MARFATWIEALFRTICLGALNDKALRVGDMILETDAE